MFYKIFFKKTTKEKISQLLVYSICFIIVAFILLNDRPILELVKDFFWGLAQSFIIILILFASNFLIYRLHKKHLQIGDIISFTILTKLLISPILLIFFGLFIYKENYNYFFAFNILDVAVF